MIPNRLGPGIAAATPDPSGIERSAVSERYAAGLSPATIDADSDAKGRLLLVDDEVALLEVWGEILRDAGWRVETASDGTKALELLVRGSFDAILTDIDMPGLNGLQLLRAIRARDLDVPVVLMTGNPRTETAIEAVEQGALRYLVKPVGAAILTEAVEAASRLHRIARLKREALAYLGGESALPGDLAGLQAAFTRGLQGLWMAYQPIVRADGTLFGHEALMRCELRALPGPAPMFDAAERLGRVHDLGRTIRARAAASLNGASPAVLFVNVHALELTDADLYRPSAPLSARAGAVVLEVTERTSFERVPDLRARIKGLRDLGYRIAVDDLGAGYAGLTSFAALEPDVVKLDMALVRGVDREPIKHRLVGSMTRLCRDLGILVVAEGVETPAEKQALLDLGCDLLQGYLFGRPGRERAV
jgi:EAL domain-containing protein (putative c-di-GMP-specific phosphodiesterase class I)/CheY-like chemotaxis protein